MSPETGKILFVINNSSGPRSVNWRELITGYFQSSATVIDFFEVGNGRGVNELKAHLVQAAPATVVAVGGDGTVSMVAAACRDTAVAMGIVPAGSANGMAAELGIPDDPEEALRIIQNTPVRETDAILINGNYVCLHLSDVGLNAYMIKLFNKGRFRGMFGYALAMFRALRGRKRFRVFVNNGESIVRRTALMVIVANASKYGTGATINPQGNLHDGFFELVIVRKLSLREILKMFLKGRRFDPKYIEVIQARSATVETVRAAHFQIDGEYMGKVRTVECRILPGALRLKIP